MKLPRLASEMSALEVKRLVHSCRSEKPETIAVGGVAGLLLQLTIGGGKSWVLRTMVGAKRREIGLGSFPEVTLASARDRARDAKSAVASGVDPIEQRSAAKAALKTAQMREVSFSASVDTYLESKLDEFRSEKH